ncbi:tagaturonate reductase [Bacillus suaedae]|uniref:Tagaturonate reductase n=1 Tax=Halalkalibacter suaedae TaxID=2822140 RepID=A0A941APK0_9BACI|nr:tagaturonate reductase [Bacillus suaedae]MBP3952870.1 tagaturonate reductase [Bacillus suaedae]
MEQLNQSIEKKNLPNHVTYEKLDSLPEKVLQFGEGNFIRGFVDWMIHQMNKQGLFNGKVVAIQPTPHGKVVPKLNKQDGLYTVALRGFEDGQKVESNEIISSISRGINPYEDWDQVLSLAESKDIEFVFSNTTEAGLTYMEEELSEKSPLSFPGKITAFLYRRFQVFGGDSKAGLVFIPCELVERNGEVLKELVLQYATDWKLASEFIEWVKEYNQFCNTLVDRIVTGFPKDKIEQFNELLGYEDTLLTVGEPYHLFAIDGNEDIARRLPFAQAGLNVKWGDISPYREIKVRLLNGPHTMMFAVGFLSGVNTVQEVMNDKDLRILVEQGVFHEILPTVNMDDSETLSFVRSVFERFLNPFNKHYLVDIGMNAIYKFKSRLLPPLLAYHETNKQLPRAIVFSLAALIVYYRSSERKGNLLVGKRGEEDYEIRDNGEAILACLQAWKIESETDEELKNVVTTILANKQLWDLDLNEITGLTDMVTYDVQRVIRNGMKESVKEIAQQVNSSEIFSPTEKQ